MNTPHNAAYFERYMTDWTGPLRPPRASIQFRMKDSVFPGDTMVFHGKVRRSRPTPPAAAGCELSLWLSVGDKTTTQCNARVAIPAHDGDNPWTRQPLEAHPLRRQFPRRAP